MLNKKIKTEKEIEKRVILLKRDHKRIVACSGTFDLLHPGHVNFFHEARQHGDFLIVLLNSDASVRKYKGPLRPINHERARGTVLAALADVDAVVLFSQKTPVKILAHVKPDIYCQGEDWGVSCVERPVVEKYGGRVVVLPTLNGFSTTNIIKNISEKFAKHL